LIIGNSGLSNSSQHCSVCELISIGILYGGTRQRVWGVLSVWGAHLAMSDEHASLVLSRENGGSIQLLRRRENCVLQDLYAKVVASVSNQDIRELLD